MKPNEKPGLMNLIFSHSEGIIMFEGPACSVWNKIIHYMWLWVWQDICSHLFYLAPQTVLTSFWHQHFSAVPAHTNLMPGTIHDHGQLSSKRCSLVLYSHPCSWNLRDSLFSLCVFTGPPGKRGRMGRRGEPGKFSWKTHSFSISSPSFTCSHTPSLFLVTG